MKSKHLLHLIGLGVTLLYAMASADTQIQPLLPGDAVFAGMSIHPEGNALLLVQTNRLCVMNIGSSGRDGVSMRVARADELYVSLEAVGPLAVGQSLSLSATGILNNGEVTFLSLIGLRNHDDHFELFVTAASRASNVMVKVFAEKVEIGRVMVPAGNAVASITNSAPGLPRVLGMGVKAGDAPASFIALDRKVIVIAANGEMFTGDEIQVCPLGLAGVIPSLDTVTLTGESLDRFYVICLTPGVPIVRRIEASGNGVTITWDGGGNLECAEVVTGPWSVVTGATSPYDTATTAASPAGFYRVSNSGNVCCAHDISLYNQVSGVFYAVEIMANTASTHIISATPPPGFTQLANYPTMVRWTYSGGPIPAGLPFPVPGWIWEDYVAAGNQSVVVRWLDINGTALCSQVLTTTCPCPQDGVEGGESVVSGFVTNCLQVWATTACDIPSQQKAVQEQQCEAAFEVQPAGGCRKFQCNNFSWTIPAKPITSTWSIEKFDSLLDYSPYSNFTVVYNGIGEPCFTFGDPGHYRILLSIAVDGTNCQDETHQTIDIPEFQAGFTWKQKLCMPDTLQFDASTSVGTIVSYLWTITNPNGTAVTLSDSTSPMIEHMFTSFPPSGQHYTVCLEITEADGCKSKVCQDVFFAPCHAAFRFSYNGCLTTETYTVTFFNDSIAQCPARFAWSYDNGPPEAFTSNDPLMHTHALTVGTHTVTLTITDPNGIACDVTKTIVVAPCPVDFMVQVCADSSVSFMTTVPNPYWTFPNGNPSSKVGEQNLKVVYDQIGTYSATLVSTNANFCWCSKTVQFTVTEIYDCARNDRCFQLCRFKHEGIDYLMRYSAKERNTLSHRIIGEVSLWRADIPGAWYPYQARKISVSWDGEIHLTEGKCDCAKAQKETFKPEPRKWRVWHRTQHNIGKKFRIRRNAITFTYSVTVGTTKLNELTVTRYNTLGLDHDIPNNPFKQFDPFECESLCVSGCGIHCYLPPFGCPPLCQ